MFAWIAYSSTFISRYVIFFGSFGIDFDFFDKISVIVMYVPYIVDCMDIFINLL